MATEAWTEGLLTLKTKKSMLKRTELAASLANVSEGAASSTVSQTEPGHRLVAWQAVVDRYAPNSSNDPAKALQPMLARPKRCRSAKEVHEKFTAWSLKVAEYEHQFKSD